MRRLTKPAHYRPRIFIIYGVSRGTEKLYNFIKNNIVYTKIFL
jgi:hypothetical protein